jgi:phytoene synthase
LIKTGHGQVMAKHKFQSKSRPTEVWSIEEWTRLEQRTRARALQVDSEQCAWSLIIKQARRVMRAYTTSFFIVTRFLPTNKRAEVEAIYATVRYPDEIVDTFPLTVKERLSLLDRWQEKYEVSLQTLSLADALRQEVPCFLAAFAKVVRERRIPSQHYRTFLNAMRRDINPRPFATLDDLIENYIYGSAIVVGYFLTHVYGAPTEDDFTRALESARDLGIALQLTNFLRDIAEDQRRGRVYFPLDMLSEEGIEDLNTQDERQAESLHAVQRRLAHIARTYYASAKENLDAFNSDCRPAIYACIEVYGRLNERIAASDRGIGRRESVPLREKFRVLPPSKYWRIPLAYFLR